MELIDQYYRPEAYTFVFNDIKDDQYLMLEMPANRWQLTDYFYGDYDPNGANEQLGRHKELQELGHLALMRFFQRLSIPDQYGRGG
jgi:hypothetical protein